MAIAVFRAGLVAIGLIWLFAVQTVRADDAKSYVKPGSRAAGALACVEPTDFMRRNHMELIKHQRDATVHFGIRSTKHSLAGCIDCHVSRDAAGHAVAVNADHQFCNACHAFAAVDVNCFDCHAAIPRGGPVSEAAGRRGSGQASAGAPGEAGATPIVAPAREGGAQ
jgi:hypothetical protein